MTNLPVLQSWRAQGLFLSFAPGQHSHLIPYLAAIHASCITHDRTIATFLPPLSHEKLLAWWKERIAEINEGRRVIHVLVNDLEPGGRPKGPDVTGVILLFLPSSETGASRGVVEELLVHKNFRGKGVATTLMNALESEALRRGRTLLVCQDRPLPVLTIY